MPNCAVQGVGVDVLVTAATSSSSTLVVLCANCAENCRVTTVAWLWTSLCPMQRRPGGASEEFMNKLVTIVSIFRTPSTRTLSADFSEALDAEQLLVVEGSVLCQSVSGGSGQTHFASESVFATTATTTLDPL